MPKGKKKGKRSGKKGKKGKSSNAEPEPIQAVLENEDDDIFEDKEQQLKDKLFKINKDIEDAKIETEEMKARIKKMEEETEKITNESNAYANYLSEMDGYRKDNLVTLQDYYKDRIDYFNNERNMAMTKHEMKQSEILEITKQKEMKIATLTEEIKEYDDCIALRNEQQAEIKQLETEIQTLRYQQAAELDQLKLDLLAEHQKFQQESNEKLNEIAQVAFKEALGSLSTACQKVRDENRNLRAEMLWTINQNQILKDRKIKLMERNRVLKEELQFAKDFAALRKIRQEKPSQLNELIKHPK